MDCRISGGMKMPPWVLGFSLFAGLLVGAAGETIADRSLYVDPVVVVPLKRLAYERFESGFREPWDFSTARRSD